jgi:hypothetical protein
VGYARAGSNPAFGTIKNASNNKGLAITGWPFVFEVPINSTFSGGLTAKAPSKQRLIVIH